MRRMLDYDRITKIYAEQGMLIYHHEVNTISSREFLQRYE